MLNDPQLYQDVVDGLGPLLSCVDMPDGRNTVFGVGDLNRRMMAAAVRDSSVGGCASAIREAGNKEVPTDRWCASMLKGTDIKLLQEQLHGSIVKQLKALKKHKKIPKKGITVAVDLHLIPRYDKKPGKELTRSRYKNGTRNFERYMTVQCIDKNAGFALGAQYLQMGDSVPDSLRVLLKSVSDMDVKIRLVLLDREFFSVDTITFLKKHKVPFLMPCRNTGNVVAALREFAEKRRSSVSGNMIEGSGKTASYDMVITKRKNAKNPEKPEERYIGFATNVPDQNTRQYASRWGIETAYRLVEEMRPKTRVTNMSARMLCFYYALAAYNEWMMLRMLYSDYSGRQCKLTQLVFKYWMEAVLIREPKPPP